MNIRIIRDEDTYKRYLVVAKELMATDPEKGSDDGDKLDLLVHLISFYEAKKYPLEKPSRVEAMKFRMEQSGSPFNPNYTVHPSETILEILEDRKIPLQTFLYIDGLDKENVNSFLKKSSVLSDSDVERVANFLNISKEMLTNLQNHHLEFMEKNPDYVLE